MKDMIQIKRHQKKEEYSRIRNQMSQEQSFALFQIVCLSLVLAAACLIYIAIHNLI